MQLWRNGREMATDFVKITMEFFLNNSFTTYFLSKFHLWKYTNFSSGVIQ